jgi:PIN domain nuclease of toxin-antitoxin system
MRTILCDTCTMIWLLAGTRDLSKAARAAISHPEHRLAVSVGSLIEIAAKSARGRSPISVTLLRSRIADSFTDLTVGGDIAERMERLPPHHLDPFDRLIVAQAQANDAVILSPDPAFRLYAVETLW